MGCGEKTNSVETIRDKSLKAIQEDGGRVYWKTHPNGEKEIEGFSFYQTGSKPETIEKVKHFPEIKNLNLTDSSVSDEILLSLNGLTNLEVLGLGGTHLTDHGLRVLENFKKLKELIGPGASVSSEGWDSIKDLVGLEYLHGMGHNIEDFNFTLLKNLTHLKSMTLPCKDLEDEDLQHLSHLKNLKVLYLSSQKFSGTGVRHLNQKTLSKLFTYGSHISTEGLKVIGRLPNLTWLNLSENDLSGGQLKAFAENGSFSKLEYMDVSGTKISDEDIKWIASNPSIRELRAERVKITPKCLESIKGAPSLKACYFFFTLILPDDVELAELMPGKKVLVTNWRNREKALKAFE